MINTKGYKNNSSKKSNREFTNKIVIMEGVLM